MQLYVRDIEWHAVCYKYLLNKIFIINFYSSADIFSIDGGLSVGLPFGGDREGFHLSDLHTFSTEAPAIYFLY